MSAEKQISFYDVPLRCNAVTHIGCGSRSKPVLLDLQNDSSVRCAWLNRTGTTIALEWCDDKDSVSREDVVASVFRKYELRAEELDGAALSENLKSFNHNDIWLAGSAVDELSKEEARVFAERVLSVVKKGSELSGNQEKRFGVEIQAIFYEFFLNYESFEQLSDIGVYRDKMQHIIELGEQYVGEGNMPDTNALLAVCCKDLDCCE